ncbi:hypothetical protein M427DRAFT_54440 [Gonapodya prolifera JEL478]|uniref:F-box domain-containing protein n=1 Tax=Gonapodya prolifera (strain JEL478) TaxID=1344416 RepID=A0A139AL44_GONPJ|nr:hypothetical protein M427DRAFT_54440 [Gonapodya prolifera JEL478]|eukprot:KXS17496.1 hypothetical protein M427DRAFT_54440 [Gonapodya prolifera JEL478]
MAHADAPSHTPRALSLPPELWHGILALLRTRDIAHTAETCRFLHRAAQAQIVWREKARTDFGFVHSPETQVSAFHLYKTVLTPYARFVGFWHADFPFFNSRLVQCRITPRGVIVGEELAALTGQSASPFSLDPALSVDALDPVISRETLFEIVPQTDADPLVLCHGNQAINGRSGSEGLLHTAWLKENEMDVLPAVLASNQRWFVPRGHPNPTTGLFPFAHTWDPTEESSQPFSPGPSDHAHRHLLLSIDCEHGCYTSRLRTVSFRRVDGRNEIQSTTLFRPTFSLVAHPRAVADVDRVLAQTQTQTQRRALTPRQGIWVGTYGSHGQEFVLLQYADGARLEAHKITGDLNVPRGELSWSADLSREVDVSCLDADAADGDEARSYNLTQAAEFSEFWEAEQEFRAGVRGNESENENGGVRRQIKGLRAFRGSGTVAMPGYREASSIGAHLIVLSDKELLMFWHGLRKLSRFICVFDN